MKNKKFTDQERQTLETIMLHRRDVRGNRFIDKAVSDEAVDNILSAALLAPSVGFSQPWEFVIIRERLTKERIVENYKRTNAQEQAQFNDEKQEQYARLKLEGILDAPVNIAVFYKPENKPVLGQTSMEEVGLYSVVCAVQNMWLMSRAMNIGLGWVSILDPEEVKQTLNAPKENQLVAYLCLGYVSEFLEKPELELLQWEKRKPSDSMVYYENYL